MIKPKKQSKSSTKTIVPECLKIKPLKTKTKRKSKQMMKTMTSSLQTSKVRLNDKPKITQSSIPTVLKSKSKKQSQRVNLLKLYTEGQIKSKQISPNRIDTSNTMLIQKPSLLTLSQSFHSKFLSKCLDIVSSLLIQVEYQKQVRHLKHLVNESNFQFVLQEFRLYNIKEEQLALQIDEYDPLLQPQELDNLGQQLCKRITLCTNNWENNLRHKFTKQQVMSFFQQIDKDINGLISITTFARQLGNSASKVLRIKDLFRIFKRLESGNTISLNSLMRELSTQY